MDKYKSGIKRVRFKASNNEVMVGFNDHSIEIILFVTMNKKRNVCHVQDNTYYAEFDTDFKTQIRLLTLIQKPSRARAREKRTNWPVLIRCAATKKKINKLNVVSSLERFPNNSREYFIQKACMQILTLNA